MRQEKSKKGNWTHNIYRSAHQQPKIPEIRGDDAEHLDYGCEQDDILQMPETRTHRRLFITVINEWNKLNTVSTEEDFVFFSKGRGLVSKDEGHNEEYILITVFVQKKK